MRNLLVLAGAAALATVSVAASADTVAVSNPAPAVKAGALLISSDGKRLGRVDRVRKDAIGVIIDQRYVYVPLSTISAGENGRLVTSLTARDANR
jgi:hypothetical protein